MNTTETLHRTAFAALALVMSGVGLTAVAGPANAGEVRVSVSGTASEVDARLNRAARLACDMGGNTLSEQRLERKCVSATMSDVKVRMANRTSGFETAATSFPADQS
jgi:UrcA family protein